MAKTIFYSWQSDLPNSTNRTFIEGALELAIKQLNQTMPIQEALREDAIELDRDTKGVPGTPPIVETIFNKISDCAIFVPDLTFVAKTEVGRYLPNPNVLIEYGWALKAISHSRIVPVMNDAYGSPSVQTMPFDMRHLRNPIVFSISEQSSPEMRKAAKAKLAKDLASAFQTIISKTLSNTSKFERQEYDGHPWTSSPSTFVKEDESFEMPDSNARLIIPSVQKLFLRIIPRHNLSPLSKKAALDLLREGTLVPMLAPAAGSGWHMARNPYGAFVFSERNNEITHLTQLFPNGEIWGIDAETIDKRRMDPKVSFGYFPFSVVRTVFLFTLQKYLKFCENSLRLPLPLKFVAGATGVNGYRMPAPPGRWFPQNSDPRFGGNVVDDNIIFEFILDESYKKDPTELLEPFFQQFWEECGLDPFPELS